VVWVHISSLTPKLVLKDGEDFRSRKYEDTKEAIIIHKSKKNRQHNGQKKKYKGTNNDLKNTHIKLKIE
jgi:hypothetical protein